MVAASVVLEEKRKFEEEGIPRRLKVGPTLHRALPGVLTDPFA